MSENEHKFRVLTGDSSADSSKVALTSERPKIKFKIKAASPQQASPYNRDHSINVLTRKISDLPNCNQFIVDRQDYYPSDEQNAVDKIYAKVVNNPNKTYLGFMSLFVIGSPRNHAAALVISPDTKKIIFQDPLGHSMPVPMRQLLEERFADYSFIDTLARQQHDDASCAVITVENLYRLAQDEPIQLRPNTAVIRQAHTDLIP